VSARWCRWLVAVAAGLASILLSAGPAAAHPLGNFTVNQYSGLVVQPRSVDIHLVLDMAEIPTLQTLQSLGAGETALPAGAVADGYRIRECGVLREGVRLRRDADLLPLAVTTSTLTFPPGAGGLHTLRLVCDLTTTTPRDNAGHMLRYTKSSFADRIGWREITARSVGVHLATSDAKTASVSAELTRYPKDLLTSPLDEQTAVLKVTKGAGTSGAHRSAIGPLVGMPRGVDRLTQSFTDLVSRQHLGVAFTAVSLVIAVLLGAIHAFAPGHGKTVMAAYLVGQRGSLRQAAVIGLTITATHTAGVVLLAIALTTTLTLTPERIYPWTTMASGLILAAIGLSLLRRFLRQRRSTAVTGNSGEQGHEHSHPHPHPQGPHHARDGSAHSGRLDTHAPAQAGISTRSLLGVGFAGGLVPSPSALVVILGAIALHRAWFGLLLVLCYGVGMAVALTGTGYLLVHARSVLDRRVLAKGKRPLRRPVALLLDVLPGLTAVVVVLLGVGLAARGLAGM